MPVGFVAGWRIRDASGPADVAAVRRLFEEYRASLDVDLCFQDFDRELAELPGDYAPPHGCLLVAECDGTAVGCVALRPLGGATRGGEVKRLYVQPHVRGTRLGRALAMAVIERARAIGYRELKLDTLATMTQARALYASLGFRACAPYYRNPLPGTAYMALALRDPEP
ncbi:MAG TPA: GNAT family N-acetyltransferase [Casimicrobiaceae bacterium]